ncbi:pimeloyl-ACP methyl ester carboxylesterase [Actinomadura coerulea]|uniref:Pimeloyl-ACP methyl ester carboxylesterase n=1 Tax=Actinomadura coerulea TaxID=46159 RepID=A0A7X0G3M1_9ACTN|nr:alpha/beta hydrolase [Actinomadura coerulea]MBB6398848.1 pimeloyl-ACP methyl ester carboxylesterase [Actinomadura coerulea]GGP98820.1 alpha/beta hydrolase [Actinomadura coerulea]
MTDTVPMWHDQRGKGDPVVLLHGGLTDSRCFTGNLDGLADTFELYLPDRRGHGRTPDAPGPITMELMARDTIAFLEEVVGGPARLVGYSAGGTVALRVAMRRPDLVERLVLISTAYDLDGLIFKPSADGEMPAELVDAYAEVSPDGRDHFPVVLGKIAHAAATEPEPDPADLRAVTARTLVLAGDDDLVTLDHTVALYRALPTAELAVLPNASHLLLMEHAEAVRAMVLAFLTTDAAPTYMPIARAHHSAFEAE